jgi:hypothetical protein
MGDVRKGNQRVMDMHFEYACDEFIREREEEIGRPLTVDEMNELCALNEEAIWDRANEMWSEAGWEC